jgi:hypothetical protein
LTISKHTALLHTMAGENRWSLRISKTDSINGPPRPIGWEGMPAGKASEVVVLDKFKLISRIEEKTGDIAKREDDSLSIGH